MITKLFKLKRMSYTVLALLGSNFIANGQVITDSLVYTGSAQTYIVPCNVGSLEILCYGGEGGNGAQASNFANGGVGGKGGFAKGTLSVVPGQAFFVFVGGNGFSGAGFNGGGNGPNPTANGTGAGGGATDVRTGNGSLADRLIVAGGGGGGGRAGCETLIAVGGKGGDGGGGNGSAGTDAPTTGGFAGAGQGGSGQTGGAAGIGCGGFLGQPGVSTTTNVGGTGGGGQTCCCFSVPSIPGGGGGGGGFLGGGGGGAGSAGTATCSGNDKGAGGGGAGGTSYIASSFSNTTLTPGLRSGHGVVYFRYTCNLSSIQSVALQYDAIKIAPNPNNGIFDLYMPIIDDGATEIILLSVDGKRLRNYDYFLNGKNTIQMNLSEFENGIYFINVKSGSVSKTLRLVKHN